MTEKEFYNLFFINTDASNYISYFGQKFKIDSIDSMTLRYKQHTVSYRIRIKLSNTLAGKWVASGKLVPGNYEWELSGLSFSKGKLKLAKIPFNIDFATSIVSIGKEDENLYIKLTAKLDKNLVTQLENKLTSDKTTEVVKKNSPRTRFDLVNVDED